MKNAMYSPWGFVQTDEPLAEGINRITTASHGGLHLSQERWEQLTKAFPKWQPFAGEPRWLEEDVDWALAAILWPESFDDRSVRAAILTVRNTQSRGVFYFPDAIAWLNTTGEGRMLTKILELEIA